MITLEKTTNTPKVLGRLAPTPSGFLHLGNILSFMVAYIYAHQNNGDMVFRMEDLDPARSKQVFCDAIVRDLEWLGFTWETPILYQSSRTEAYTEAFEALARRNVIYPCFCSRADIHAASAPHRGEEVIYPGMCRNLTEAERQNKRRTKQPSYRIQVTDEPIEFFDIFQGQQLCTLPEICGDFIVRRADGVYAYQLASVVDDNEMGVTNIIRGIDLLTSTPRQWYLQDLLGWPHPTYGHIPLLVDENGHRLSKRAGDISIQSIREDGVYTAKDVLGSLAFTSGIIEEDAPYALDELVQHAHLSKLQGKKQLALRTLE